MKTHLEIWKAHLEAFEQGIVTVDSTGPKFSNAGDLYEALLSGELNSTFFQQCVTHADIPCQAEIGSWLMRKFSVKNTAKLKKTFMRALYVLENRAIFTLANHVIMTANGTD